MDSATHTNQPSSEENLIAAIALGKTIAFLFYSCISLFLTIALTMVYFQPASPHTLWNAESLATFAALEIVVLWLVICGWLPATGSARASAFSEQQAAWGLTAMSCVPWFLFMGDTWFKVFMWGINGTLLLVALVYFVTKSVLSRSLRTEVLGILLLPTAHLVIARLFDA